METETNDVCQSFHASAQIRVSGAFNWSRSKEEALAITPEQYAMLMQGLEIVARHPIEQTEDSKKLFYVLSISQNFFVDSFISLDLQSAVYSQLPCLPSRMGDRTESL